jgi:Nif-specific regulatory protein
MHRKIGMFEKANHGSMFLDEANNLAHDIQAKLLQFMQDFTVTRVGGEKPVKLDLRILVASSLDLGEMVKKQVFREDLYYRIAVVTLDLPLLKNRREDLPELCQHFLDMFNQSNKKNIKRISSAAYKKMFDYHWPGNIRELKNVVERAVIFCDGEEIREGHIQTGPSSEQPAVTAEPGKQARKANEPINLTKPEILSSLKRHKGMVKRLAEEMGVTKRALYYHFKKLGITPNRLRKNPRAGEN